MGTIPSGMSVGNVNVIFDAAALAATAIEPTRTFAPLRNAPLIVTVALGAPDAGETLVTTGAAPPAWNLGSLGGTRRLVTTEPPTTFSDLMHGAVNVVPLHLCRNPTS